MANYYLDFVGLNSFIYERVGYSSDMETEYVPYDESLSLGGIKPSLNHINSLPDDGTHQLITNFWYARTLKNYKFSHELPNTASFFPALMLHRNGPYGFPMWKQIRVGQNPLTRKQVKNNIFTHVVEPGGEVSIDNSNIRSRYGAISSFIETPVISRYKPMVIRGEATFISQRTGEQIQERFDINSSFGNKLASFNNEELDKYYNLTETADETYEQIKNLYLEGGLDATDSPMDIFQYLKYAETIYPTQLYTNVSYTRQRTTFSFDWRDSRADRVEGPVDNGFGSVLTQSVWPLDVSRIWATTTKRTNDVGLIINGLDPNEGDYGILQNNYSQTDANFSNRILDASLNVAIRPAPIYNRKHMLTLSASVVSQNGMTIEGITDGSGTNLDSFAPITGEAKWEAGDQAGKNPFYDTYDDYIQGVRQRGKGYTIVPEYRISNHISTLKAEGFDNKMANMFELTGGISSSDTSDESLFYKTYSTTEFLKHFDLVKDDHKGFTDPAKIKLRCKAIKKFLPYNGFYPCQRTVNLAEQFYSSYNGSVTVASGSSFDYEPLADSAQIGFQNLLAPMFAPGVLFNSIKSGVACDYPIISGSLGIAEANVIKSGDNYLLDVPLNSSRDLFDKRIPFQAIIEPQRHLAQTRISCNEPHIDANHSSSCFWDGTGDDLYKMMAHNFLAEVPEFFLQGKELTTIYSRKSDHPEVGNAISGSTYSMRVKMYKSVSGSVELLSSGSSPGDDSYFSPPQYGDSVNENFTMYSRPSAFGPPSQATVSAGFLNTTGSDSEKGENFPFTPPYYYGEAWADIKFTATETKKYSIDEIIRGSEVEYYRFLHPSSSNSGYIVSERAGVINALYNNNAMQISASIDLFAQIDDTPSTGVTLPSGLPLIGIDVSSDKTSRWVIQPRFETPMLNFNHLSASTSLTLPTYGSQSVPRGMWHQYGQIETDPQKGVFLQVVDIPIDFRKKIIGSIDESSLIDLCGFNDESVRLGQVATAKTISEAVVAVPFIEEEGQRKFFTIERETVDLILDNPKDAQLTVGNSVIEMVNKMKRFVFPPSFDFVHNRELDPFAMYVFEFKETLTQQDLADVWQNLPPTIGTSFDESSATIEHTLLADELLGGGQVIENNNRLKSNPLPDRIKWMVFKAKQRAKTNYYDKLAKYKDSKSGQSSVERFNTAKILRPDGFDTDVSYNWPYDFFSLVEVAKIDAEVTFADITAKDKEPLPIVPKEGIFLRDKARTPVSSAPMPPVQDTQAPSPNFGDPTGTPDDFIARNNPESGAGANFGSSNSNMPQSGDQTGGGTDEQQQSGGFSEGGGSSGPGDIGNTSSGDGGLEP